jgi:hypothetical protein
MSDIQAFVSSLRIIDGHEHLSMQAARQRDQTGLFGLMHYLDSDLISAGMPREALARQTNTSLEEKAATFLTYWNKTRNTAYARMFRTAMEDLYGMNDWSVNGLLDLHEKIGSASNNPDWYRHVLQERSGIDLALTLIQTTNVDFSLFRPVMFFDFTFRLRTLKDIHDIEKGAGMTIRTFRQYLEAVDALFHKYVHEGMAATKLGHAYWRTLACGKPTEQEAEAVFNKFMNHPSEDGLSQAEWRPFQDYLIHYVIRRSIAHGLPIQIHTGHLETSVSGDGNIITNSRVSDLLPLLAEYPDARFVLLHTGFPYHSEYMSIVKNYPNAYADFTWIYVISPTVAKQTLHAMIEMVPQSKIHAFGGDYNYIEGTYAHQKLARRLVAEVLEEKVREGALDEDEAIDFAKAVFRNNLIEFYQLNQAKV